MREVRGIKSEQNEEGDRISGEGDGSSSRDVEVIILSRSFNSLTHYSVVSSSLEDKILTQFYLKI